MEIRNRNALKHEKIRAAVFDFDGTISTLRQGWESVMRPLMLEMISPYGADPELEGQVARYIDESTGIQTIFQMQGLVKMIAEYGRNTVVHDEWWYKIEYNQRLMQYVKGRLSDLISGRLDPSCFMIKCSQSFLQRLKLNNIDLYAASGTDHEDVMNEVQALGLMNYFSGVAGAPFKKMECSKDAVIRDLIENKKLKGNSLLVIGDGKVEILLGKEAGALTLGAATDEVNRRGINEIKRQRLIKAGADVIVGDFCESKELSDWLGLV